MRRLGYIASRPISRINRAARLRLMPNSKAIRRLPKYGRLRYSLSIRRINARFSAVSTAGW